MTRATIALENAIAAGLDYILSNQARDGSWTEWALPPGSSSVWTTAYIGYKLQNLLRERISIATPHILAAAHWLNENIFADCGWGYNKVVGSDADSTSYAILFLILAGQQVSDATYAVLSGLQREDGGFATYLPVGRPHSWNVSHPEVTPVALLALLSHFAPDQTVIQRGIKYVHRQKTSAGLWNSFWWSSCLYGTEANLSFLHAAGIRMPFPYILTQIQSANAFELALLISCLLYGNDEGSHLIVSDLVDQLIRQQEPNGSWNSAPILRITRQNCYEPWASSDPGQLYAETKGLFTTATVLHTLARVNSR